VLLNVDSSLSSSSLFLSIYLLYLKGPTKIEAHLGSNIPRTVSFCVCVSVCVCACVCVSVKCTSLLPFILWGCCQSASIQCCRLFHLQVLIKFQRQMHFLISLSVLRLKFKRKNLCAAISFQPAICEVDVNIFLLYMYIYLHK